MSILRYKEHSLRTSVLISKGRVIIADVFVSLLVSDETGALVRLFLQSDRLAEANHLLEREP